MKERTIDTIRIIKRSNTYPAEFALRNFLCEYTNTIPEDWPFQSLCAVLRDVVADYLMNCGDVTEIARYFTDRSSFVRNEWEIMIAFIYNIRVRKNGTYIHGFKEEDFHD